MNTQNIGNEETQPRDPSCFEEWLHMRLKEQPDREDETGRVARWVLERMKPGHPSPWVSEPVLLARYGHAYDVPARYETYLRHVANQPEESVQTFFRVYDVYLKEVSADYDRKIEEVGKKLYRTFGGGGVGDDGGTTTGGAEPHKWPEKDYSWESWTRFFYELHGPEVLGYEVDEDGYPIDPEPEGDGRGH